MPGAMRLSAREVLLALGVIATVAPAAVPVTPQTTLTGRVTIVELGRAEPVRRAKVTLTGGTANVTARTTDTDTDGWYRFDEVSPGTLRVHVAKPGFVMPGRGSHQAIGAPVRISAEPARLDLELLRGSAIEGRVLDEAGRPLPDIQVSVVRFEYDLIGRHPIDVIETTTDSNGAYRLHTLPAGAYYVRARPNQLQTADPVRIPGRPPMVPAMTYYPGTARSEQAGRIEIGVGQEVSGMDIALTSVEAALVGGRIVRSAGDLAPRLSVRLQAVGGPVGEVRGGFLPETGDFFYRAVPPGDYWLSAVTLTADGRLEAIVQRLTVAGADMTGLTLQTAPGRDVLARVVVDDGTPAPADAKIVAPETALNLPAPIDGPGPGPTAGPAGNAINLGPLFGPRLIRVERLPPGYALAAVLLDGLDVTDTPVDFQATPGSLEVRLTTAVGRAAGTVRDGEGRPAAGLDVVAFAADDAKWGGVSRFVKATETGVDGAFELDGLLPGAYYVAAGVIEPNAWMSPDVLRRLVTGTPVDVRPGETTELALTPGGVR